MTDYSSLECFHKIFAAYDRRFSEAMATITDRRPWIDDEREEILRLAQKILGIKKDWVPEIHPNHVSGSVHDGYSTQQLQATSWPGCQTAADLYFPDQRDSEELPIVILACGHGDGGKRSTSYRGMAVSLARNGFAVLVPDNIGQGERISMGHRDVVQVFEYGLTLQGLIVMETMGWLKWLKNQRQFDSKRISIIGNSGGGTLSLFVGAFCRDDLAVISSSGYPSTFEFIARKEKKHCHCNLLPRIVGELEMWQIYGTIAPKPLFLFQGKADALFPPDLFFYNARKVATAYELRNAAEQFRAEVTPGDHSWDKGRIQRLTEYLCKQFNIPFKDHSICFAPTEEELPLCFEAGSFHSKTADEIASELTGNSVGVANHLSEVFAPDVPRTERNLPFTRGDTSQILAQFEGFLKKV